MVEVSGTNVAAANGVVSSDVGNVAAIDGDLSGNFAVLGSEGKTVADGEEIDNGALLGGQVGM
jgi:hypothetical protein